MAFSLPQHLGFVMAAPGLPVLTPIEYQPFRGKKSHTNVTAPSDLTQTDDIVYLLHKKNDNIRHYSWEHEPDGAPAPALTLKSHSRDLSHESWHTEESYHSIDSIERSYPYPIDFDAINKASGESIAITVKEGKESNKEEKVVFEGHVARFHVGDWGLMKGRSKASRKEAMEELFSRVHTLAERYRAEAEEERARAEKRATEVDQRIAGEGS
jgi:hypothetical protein